MTTLRTLFCAAALFCLGAPACAQDTLRTDSALSLAPRAFLEQTMDGTRTVTEEGIAAFFPSTLRGKSVANAFHNTAPRGTIIEVTNQNNGRKTYVKVIGPIPPTKTFHNCIIGISAGARAALDVRDERTRCTLRFAGY